MDQVSHNATEPASPTHVHTPAMAQIDPASVPLPPDADHDDEHVNVQGPHAYDYDSQSLSVPNFSNRLTHASRDRTPVLSFAPPEVDVNTETEAEAGLSEQPGTPENELVLADTSLLSLFALPSPPISPFPTNSDSSSPASSSTSSHPAPIDPLPQLRAELRRLQYFRQRARHRRADLQERIRNLRVQRSELRHQLRDALLDSDEKDVEIELLREWVYEARQGHVHALAHVARMEQWAEGLVAWAHEMVAGHAGPA